MTISEPVSDCVITVTELILSEVPGEPKRLFTVVKFKRIAELKEYLLDGANYSIAKSLGYNVMPPERLTRTAQLIGRLSLQFEDWMKTHPTFEFDSVNDFAKFLDEHPSVAKGVGYIKKGA